MNQWKSGLPKETLQRTGPTQGSLRGASGTVQRAQGQGIQPGVRPRAAPPRVVVTYVNGVEEVIDAVTTPAQELKKHILDRGRLLETEQMFREAGEPWPVVIPEEEIYQSFPGTKPKKAEEKPQAQ
ncbi:39S ribosomal protein L53/MRP-L53 [Rhynchospora pubera]|uniref:39S ribosomal protein L53/MRP-L53 n=1 Tax=Rhynchospora pubera TaxID=906938 RepID=A0AAV8F3E4_9POAL|nr:39S ribosomal protein L53/MRP-L53 [Rhynchospora pubera]KAJ4785502.1 39S ribosomal protein L53/MRP-L53 [Rhynchospora pubera]